MGRINTIVFDLDGTLLNTLDDIADSMNYALEECGYPKREKSEIRKFIGGGASVLVASAVPEGLSASEVDACKNIFLRHYVKNANNKTDLYDGIRPLIHRLAADGYPMGVVSSKGDGPVKELIHSYFGEDMAVAIGERPDIRKKPAPDAVLKAIEILQSETEQAVYVGDSEVDVETAKNAGIPFIIVTWGFRDREDLVKLNPDYIVDTAEELYDVIKKH